MACDLGVRRIDSTHLMCINFVYRVPMKRLGSSEEVVKTVAFLLSDDASYTTAANLTVDGGMSGGLKA